MPDVNEVFAGNVFRFRRQAMWSQRQLAEEADISVDAVWKIEQAKHSATLNTVQKLADTFGVTPAQMLADDAQAAAMRSPEAVEADRAERGRQNATASSGEPLRGAEAMAAVRAAESANAAALRRARAGRNPFRVTPGMTRRMPS